MHSSSLIAGTSLGTIDGTGLMRSVWVSGIESPLENPDNIERCQKMRLFSAPLVARRGRRGARSLAAHDSNSATNHGIAGPCRPFLTRHPSGPFRPLQGSEALLYAAPSRTPKVSPIPR